MKATNVVNFPRKQKKASNTARAIYTFAFTTLIGPALGAALLGAIYLVSGVLHLGPPSLKSLPLSSLPAYTAQRVLDGYVWSAIPALLTALVLAALVYRAGTFHWLYGALAAAVSATLMATLSGGVAADHAYFIATIAAVSAVLGRLVLVAGRIVD